MSELATHLRKDVRLLMTDPMFAILLVLLAGVSFMIALVTCAAYINGLSGYSNVVTKASLLLEQKEALALYWGSIGSIFMVIFTVIAALALTGEKESGMVRYTLTHKSSRGLFYLSKLVVLMIVVIMAMLIALAAYLIVFAVMDVPMLDAGSLAASMVFPFLIAMVFSAMGLCLSTLSSKKAGVIVASVAIFFLLSFLSSISLSLGIGAAYEANNHVTADNVTAYIPLGYKLLIYGNPLVLNGGTSEIMGVASYYLYSPQLFDAGGGIALGLLMFGAWVGLGLLSFSRERMDHGWITTIRGWRERA